jgi:hypothetical protein
MKKKSGDTQKGMNFFHLFSTSNPTENLIGDNYRDFLKDALRISPEK